MALFDPNRNRKGSGFTNINRVLNANQGNKLGTTVSSNVQNQANDVRSNVQKSQQQFQQEAEKNRLDTDENKQQRDNVIGRFETQNFQPDESKFQVSTGLNDRYNQQKTALQQQNEQQQAKANQERAKIQARIDADQQEKTKAQKFLKDYNDPNSEYTKSFLKSLGYTPEDLHQSPRAREFVANAMRNSEENEKMWDARNKLLGTQKDGRNRYDASIDVLNNVLGTYNQATQRQEKQIADKLANLESQYGEMSAAEKNAWVEAERDKMIAANLPTEEEIQDFSKYRTGVYKGPKELQDFQTLLGNASQAEQVGDLTRSTGGRQELLRRFVGGDGYTQGQQRLDTMLLGQQNQGELNQARKATRGLEEDTMDANAQAGNVASEFTNRAKAFGEETVNKLNEVRNPVDTKINERLKQLQSQDSNVGGFLSKLQNTLSGEDPSLQNLDRVTRLGLGLQSAQDAGFLNSNQLGELMGEKGLIQRAEALGLNTNNLINERMQKVASQNLNRGGAATAEQESQLSSLDRLLGKSGSDIEFNQKGEDYKAGGIGFDTNSLRDYIAKTEAEKMRSTPGYQPPVVQQSTPYGQAMTGAKQIGNAANSMSGMAGMGVLGTGATMGGASVVGTAAGGVAGISPYALAASLGTDALTGGDNTAQAAEGAVNLGAGAYGMQSQGRNAVLEGLMKLNIGGQSIAGTPAGEQLSKLLSYGNQLEQKGLGELTKEGLNYADGFRDLTQTNKIDQAVAKLTGFDAAKNLTNNVGKAASTALFGGQTGNWGVNEYGTTDATTGKGVQIGSFANRSSDDILNQIMSQNQLNSTNSVGKGGYEGGSAMNLLMKYYQDALKREGK